MPPTSINRLIYLVMAKETFILSGILNILMKKLLRMPADHEFEAINFEASDLDDFTLVPFMRVGVHGMSVKCFDIIVDTESNTYYIVSPMAPWVGIKIVPGDTIDGIKRLILEDNIEVWIDADYMVYSLATTADYDKIEFADEKHEWFKDTGYENEALRFIADGCQ